MTREDLKPGTYFKIKDAVYRYEQFDSEVGNGSVNIARVCSGLINDTVNMTIHPTGIELFTYFGNVELSSNIIRFSQIAIIESKPQPQTI